MNIREIRATANMAGFGIPNPISGVLFGGEDQAHKFIISNQDGAAFSGTVSAKFLRYADNATVPLTGSIESGKATVTLIENCYNLPGRFKLTVYVTADGSTTAIYCCMGSVDRTDGASTIDPSGEINLDVTDLINQINTATASVPADYSDLLAAIAPNYTDLTFPVKAGQPCWYDGDYYRAKVDIATSETWTAAHWTAAVIGEDVADVRGILYPSPNLGANATWTNKKYIRFSTGEVTTYNDANMYGSSYIDLGSATEIIYARPVLARDTEAGSGMAFYDVNQEYISGIANGYGVESLEVEMHRAMVPNGAKYARFTYYDTATAILPFVVYDLNDYNAALTVRVNNIEAFDNDVSAVCGFTELIPVLKNDASIISGLINESGKRTIGTGRSTYELANSGYQMITVSAGNNLARVSFLTGTLDNVASGGRVPLCEGEPARHTLEAGTSATFVIPDDCQYIDILYMYTGTDQTPKSGYLYKGSAFVEGAKNMIDNAPIGRSKGGVTACIIGASIEAGTTHESADSGAVIDPTKAYLTVALQNNGVTVTNLSKGGMGYVRKANADDTTMKDIVDNTDFTAYDSVYVCLGGNDYSYGKPLGAPTDAAGDETVCGMLKYCIETIYGSNPATKLFIKRLMTGNSPNQATVPYTRTELVEVMETVCAQYGVEMISLGAIANSYNYSELYKDGKHPTQAVMAQMAKDATGRITFK